MNKVYIIENTENKKLYVGVTNRSLEERLRQHFIDARRGLDYALHCSIRKYGEEAFEIHVLEQIKDKDEAYKSEQKWIKLFNTYEGSHGYNMTEGGDCGPVMKGEDNPMYGKDRTLSKETRQKISEAQSGRFMSEEHKQKIANSLKGKTYSEERKRKIGQANKGNTMSEEARKKISKGLKESDNSTLTNDQAAEIKWLLENTDKSQTQIAENYPIGRGAVGDIKTGRTWDYVNAKNPNN